MGIIRELLNGHWSAWFEGHAEVACNGDSASHAVFRLMEATPGMETATISRDAETSTDDLHEFVVVEVCPDCGGFGRYARLNEASECGTCGGSGRVAR